MTREQSFTGLLDTYALVSVLSDKNECKVLRLRNKSQQKDLVLRSFPKVIPAYEELYHIQCDHLPVIYDSIILDDGQIVLEEFIDGLPRANRFTSADFCPPRCQTRKCDD